MYLILVESPTKSKSLKKFLGKDYQIAASLGHVRDLPKKELGIDVEHDFTPKYVIIPKAKKIIQSRPYQAVEDLINNKIVGQSVFEKIKNLIQI